MTTTSRRIHKSGQRDRSKTTTQRGLGWSHVKRRKQLLPAAIGTHCPARTPRCHGLMTVPRLMHLDHSTPRALGGKEGDRIICAGCNCWLGQQLGLALRYPQRVRRAASRLL